MIASSAAAVPPPYANPAVYRVNKVNPHTVVIPSENPGFRRLINTGWRFRQVERVSDIPRGFADRGVSLQHWQVVSIPSVWEQGGVGCYAYDFQFPSSWQGRRIFIKLGAVSSAVHFYVNGQLVGYSEDSFTPAEWDITRYLASGTNRLALRVYSQSDGADVEYGGGRKEYGLLRDVELYALPQVHLIDYHVLATLDTADYMTGLLDVTVDLSTEVKRPYQVEIEVIDTSVHPARSVLRRRRRLDVQDWFVSFGQRDNPVGPVQPWSPSYPFCYQFVIRLLDDQGGLVHSVSSWIGFRMLDFRKGLWSLNGDPLQVRGVEWQEPETSREGVRRTLSLMRQHGFNAIRLRRPASESFYNACDEMGLMVWDCCGLGLAPAKAALIGDNEDWEESLIYRAHNLVRRDRNHACVVAWGLADGFPWGYCASQVMKYFRDRDAVRAACHPDDSRSPIRVLRNPSVYRLDSEGTPPRYRRVSPLLALYDGDQFTASDLVECWDTIATHTILQGAFFGSWERLTESDRRMLQNAFATWAPDEVRYDGTRPAQAEPVLTEGRDTGSELDERDMGTRRGFFLIRWIRALFRR